MVSGGDPHLISVAKYNKYALRGVLGFDAKGGHITYENTYKGIHFSQERTTRQAGEGVC